MLQIKSQLSGMVILAYVFFMLDAFYIYTQLCFCLKLMLQKRVTF